MSFLDYLKDTPKCLYLYTWGYPIYGLSGRETYLAVVDNEWIVPEEWIGCVIGKSHGFYLIIDNETSYKVIHIKDWFDKVLNNDLICWEAACINKKFIIKEHVKLMMQTNPLQLRKEIDEKKKNLFQNEPTIDKFWELIKDCKFAVQIIDNHKIVNFKEANPEFLDVTIEDVKLEIFNELPCYKELKQRTDELLRQSKIKKILQKEKDVKI